MSTTQTPPTGAGPCCSATTTERLYVWFRNLRNLPTKWAVSHLSKQLQRDPDFRQSWQANIAMPIYDATRSAKTLDNLDVGWQSNMEFSQANHIADRLMKHLFGA